LEVVAELPQFLRGARVLEEDSIDVEGINIAGTVTIDDFPDTSDKLAQLRVVVGRDHRARCPSFQHARHESKVTHGSPSGEPDDPTHNKQIRAVRGK